MTVIEGAVVGILDFFSKNVLEAFSYDLTKFIKYFSFADTAYSIITWFSVALIILFFTFQIYKNYLGPLSDGENQFGLFARSILAIILTANGLSVCNYILNIIKTPYDALLNVKHTVTFNYDGFFNDAFTSFNKVFSDIIVGPLTHLIGLIAIIVIGWNYIRLILEVLERYVVLGCLSYLSPLAFSTLATKATNNIFRAFCRMFGSECLLMLLNVWFIRGANAAMAGLIPEAGAGGESNEMFVLHLISIIAYLRIAQRFDAYLAQLGLNTAQTGGFLGAEMLAAGAMIGRGEGQAVEGRGLAGAVFGTNRRGGAGGGNGGAFVAQNNPNSNRGVAANNMANAMNNRNPNAYAGNRANGQTGANNAALRDANALWGGNGKTVTDVQAGNGRIAARIDNGDGTFTDRRVTQGKDGRYQYKDTPIDPTTGKLDHSKTVKGEEASLAAIGTGFDPSYGIDPAEAKAHGESVLNGSGSPGETLSGDEADVAAAAMFSEQNGGNADFANTSIEDGHMSTEMRGDDGSYSQIEAQRNNDGGYDIHTNNYDSDGNFVGSMDYASDSVLGGVDQAGDVSRAVGDLESNGYDVADDAITYSAEDGFKVNASDENGNDMQFSSKENDDGSFDVSAQQLGDNGEPLGDAFSYQSDTAMGGVSTADEVQDAMGDLQAEGLNTSASYSDDDGWKISATDADGNSAEFTSSQNEDGSFNVSAQGFDSDGNAAGDPINYTSDTEMGGISDIGEAAAVSDAMQDAGYDNVGISHTEDGGFSFRGESDDGSSVEMSSNAADGGGYDMSVKSTDADGNTSDFSYHADSNFGNAGEAVALGQEVNAMQAQGLATSVSQDADGNFSVAATDANGNTTTYSSAANEDGSHTVTATDSNGNSFSYESDTAMGGISGAKDFAAEHDLGADSHYSEHGMSYDSQTGQFSGYGIDKDTLTADAFNSDGSHSSYAPNDSDGIKVTNYDSAGNATSSYNVNTPADVAQGETAQIAAAVGTTVSSMNNMGYSGDTVNIDGNGVRSAEFSSSNGNTATITSTPNADGSYHNTIDHRGADGSHQSYSYDSAAPMQHASEHIAAHDSFSNAGFERDSTWSGTGTDGRSNESYTNKTTGERVEVSSTPSASGGFDHAVHVSNPNGSDYSYDFHNGSANVTAGELNAAHQNAVNNAQGTNYTPVSGSSDGHGGYSSNYKSDSGDSMSVHSARSADGSGYDHLMTHTDRSGHSDSYAFHSDSKDVPVSEYNKMQESISSGTQGTDFRPTAVSRDAQGNYRGTFTNSNGDTMTVNATRNNNGSYGVVYDLKNSSGQTIGGNSSYTPQNSPFAGINGYQTSPQNGRYMYTNSQGQPDPSYYANSANIASARTLRTNDDGSRIIRYSNGETARVRQNSAGVNQVVSINHSPVSDRRGFTEQSYAPRTQAEAPITSKPVSAPASRPARGNTSSPAGNGAPARHGSSDTGSRVFARNSGGSNGRSSNNGSFWRRFRRK